MTSNLNENKSRWVVGITGASGMPYAMRLLDLLSQKVDHVGVIISESAFRVLQEEHQTKIMPGRLTSEQLIGRQADNIEFYNQRDYAACVASGSHIISGMIIVPCSMSSLAAIAHGVNYNLIHRAADVTIKEKRKLIIVPRETPLSQIHLENMLKLAQMGVHIVPAMPGFYSKPQSIQDLIDMQVMKILDACQIESELVKRWQ